MMVVVMDMMVVVMDMMVVVAMRWIGS